MRPGGQRHDGGRGCLRSRTRPRPPARRSSVPQGGYGAARARSSVPGCARASPPNLRLASGTGTFIIPPPYTNKWTHPHPGSQSGACESRDAQGVVLKKPLFPPQISQEQSCGKMDSEVQRDGRILDLIDDAWREDKLPYEDVAIPLNELPEPEQDNGGTTESVKEQEMKWTDLALQYLHENGPPIGN